MRDFCLEMKDVPSFEDWLEEFKKIITKENISVGDSGTFYSSGSLLKKHFGCDVRDDENFLLRIERYSKDRETLKEVSVVYFLALSAYHRAMAKSDDRGVRELGLKLCEFFQ